MVRGDATSVGWKYASFRELVEEGAPQEALILLDEGTVLL
jgi:hypothetical protein